MKLYNIKDKTKKSWDKHYLRKKSFLHYPDENFVRILSKITLLENSRVFDLGAGNGRHSFYMKTLGYEIFSGDVSPNAISMIQKQNQEVRSFLIQDITYPFKEHFFDLIVCWGVLHYNSYSDASKMIKEIQRILKKDHYFIGSIRSDRDTHLNLKNSKIQLQDLKGAYACLYSLEKVQNLLADFSDVQIGYTERTPIGYIEEKISHWIFLAKL